MAVSLTQKTAAEAILEASYGAGGSFDPDVDSLLLFTNPNPLGVTTDFQRVTPLRTAISPVKGSVGREIHTFQGETRVQGAEDLGNLKPWRFGVLLQACGLKEEWISSSASIRYRPTSTDFRSAAMRVYTDAFLHVLKGVQGTFQMQANAGEGVVTTFNLQGVYEVPTIAANPAQLFEPEKWLTWKDVVGRIDRGGGALTPVIKSFNFQLAGTTSERTDANAESGLIGFRVTGRQPTLQLVIEVDTTLGNLWEDKTNNVDHDVSFYLNPGDPGNRVFFHAPKAQITNLAYGDENGIRTWVIDYLLTGNDDEFELIFD